MVLWIDHEHAKIFNFKSEEPEISHFANRHHSTAHQAKEKSEHLSQFYHEVHDKVLNAKGLLIVGPGVAKREFKTYLEDHHSNGLNKAVLGLESMDKATDGEIKNLAKKFFHKFNLFH